MLKKNQNYVRVNQIAKTKMKQIFLIISVAFIFVLFEAQGSLPTTLPKAKVNADPAYQDLKKLLNQSLVIHDDLTAAKCNTQIGDIFYKEGALAQALEYYYKAYGILKKNNKALGIADNLNKIGRIYYKHSRFSEASACFTDALRLYKRAGAIKGIGETYSNIGLVFEKRAELDSAYHFQQLALNAFQHIKDENQIVHTYSKIGGVYEDLKKYDLALQYFLMASKLSNNEKVKSDHPALLNNIGDIYRKIGKFKLALNYTKQAEQLALKQKNKLQISSAQRDLAKTFNHLKRFDSAYFYSEKAREAYAKSFDANNNKQLNLLQTLFEVQQKNIEINNLSHEKNRNRIFVGFFSSLCILLGILGYLFYSKQKLKNTNDLLRFQTDKKAMEAELDKKNMALSSFTLHIIQKNEFLGTLSTKFYTIIKDDKRDQRKELKQLIGLINDHADLDQTWLDFRTVYEQVHENFFDKLKAISSALTATDLRFLALTKMNLSSQEVATMLGTSQESLRTTRYRIRKKLQLGENDSLIAFLDNI